MSLSSSDITTKLNGYISAIENSGKIYWNAGIVPKIDDWGFTDTKCNYPNSCTSNTFNGASQCNGFVRFMAYLLTETIIGNVYGQDYNTNIGGGWEKLPLTNYDFCPGDIVEVNDGVNEHSAMVLSVNGEDVQFIELWSSHGCKIAKSGFNDGWIYDKNHPYEEDYMISMTATNIRLYASHVIKCPPIDSVFCEPPTTLPECNDPTPTPEPEEPEEIKVPVTFKKNTQSDGGPVIETREYVVGQAYGSFPSAGSRTGYTFDGWYTDEGKPSF